MSTANAGSPVVNNYGADILETTCIWEKTFPCFRNTAVVALCNDIQGLYYWR